jgi:hypothetical protein
MSDAQDDYVKKNLHILQEMHLSGMDAEEYLTWKTKIDAVAHKYDEARVIEEDAKKAEKDQKYTADEHKRAKEVADAVAKAAPEITKSVIGAVKAFSNGDAVNGSADVWTSVPRRRRSSARS